MHICTPKDWDNFHEPEAPMKNTFNRLKEEGKVRCLNDTDINGKPVDFNIYGDDEN